METKKIILVGILTISNLYSFNYNTTLNASSVFRALPEEEKASLLYQVTDDTLRYVPLSPKQREEVYITYAQGITALLMQPDQLPLLQQLNTLGEKVSAAQNESSSRSVINEEQLNLLENHFPTNSNNPEVDAFLNLTLPIRPITYKNLEKEEATEDDDLIARVNDELNRGVPLQEPDILVTKEPITIIIAVIGGGAAIAAGVLSIVAARQQNVDAVTKVTNFLSSLSVFGAGLNPFVIEDREFRRELDETQTNFNELKYLREQIERKI